MGVIYRVTMMIVSLVIILVIGWLSGNNFGFATGHFWFISGALLLVMLSLVDQPHFSKDANIFANGATALVSLFTVLDGERDDVWWIFMYWALYLIVTSLVLMALRSRELFLESGTVQFVSRMNRSIGRPESIFSAFFLWGIFLQFDYPNDGGTINSLLLFWAIFMILNVQGIGQTVASIVAKKDNEHSGAGVVVRIQSPNVADVKLSPKLPDQIVGRQVEVSFAGKQVAVGTLFDDRIVKGVRQGRIAITSFGQNWRTVSEGGRIELAFPPSNDSEVKLVGVVSAGSSIGQLVFEVDPRTQLHAGEVVQVKVGGTYTFYQIVSATIGQVLLDEGNISQNVKVVAGQLGNWEQTTATFTPIDWVAPAGGLIEVSSSAGDDSGIPDGHCVVGKVPNSSFPVHINLSDSITHNTAIIGVTGSGKSYLAFHIIEAMVNNGVKVLILDISRQHDLHLTQLSPTALRTAGEVAAWLTGESSIGIHQFGDDANGYPKITSDFVAAAFEELKKAKLERGKNIPAKLCIVFEEAHSLIPEWNQIAQVGDEKHVNRTARAILQGRKFGMGTIIITQRTANVTKTILNQCNTVFALRSFDQTGLDFLRNYMGEAYSQSISTLPRFTAILVGQASSSSRPIILKVSDLTQRSDATAGEITAMKGTPKTPQSDL